MAGPTISVIITAFNEGQELLRTVDSVIRHTDALAEIIVVDDGSNDGSCDHLPSGQIRVIKHSCRIGVAFSRDEGSRLASGDVLGYLDGHQRISRGCLDQCARVAIDRQAIVCPDIKDYGLFGMRLHGAEFELASRNGLFSARWRRSFTRQMSIVTGLKAPLYVIPKARYEEVAWSRWLSGWGASDVSVALKAFFVGLPIVHLKGPLARHRFQRQFSYPTTWEGVWKNQAILARVCFDESTWRNYWLPEVFEPHLSDKNRLLLDSPEILKECQEFRRRKVRSDGSFWTELLRAPMPDVVIAGASLMV